MFEKQRYFKDTKNIQLNPDEKLLVQQKLSAFIQAHPVKASPVARQIGQETSPHFSSSLKTMLLKPLPITFSALLVLGGGTAFAAEQSLPNEALYPIKIHINERVRGTFTPTTTSQAKWEARLAERRLEEAEKLALNNKFDADAQAQVELNFDKQAKLVQEKIALLKAQGNVEAAAELSNSFQTSLKAHETILAQLDAQHEDKAVIDPLLEKIKQNASVISNGMVDPGTNVRVDPQAELEQIAQKIQQVASHTIANTEQDVRISTNLNAELKGKVSTLLLLANEELRKGTEQFNQVEFKLALSHYEQANSYAQEAITLINASQTLKLETLPLLPDIKFDTVKPVTDPTPLDTKPETEPSIKIDPTTNTDPDKTKLDTMQDPSIQDKAL